jgi:hypothetical protein
MEAIYPPRTSAEYLSMAIHFRPFARGDAARYPAVLESRTAMRRYAVTAMQLRKLGR